MERMLLGCEGARMKMKPKAHFQPLTPFQSPRSIPKGPDPKPLLTHFQAHWFLLFVLFQAHFQSPYCYCMGITPGPIFEIHFIIIITRPIFKVPIIIAWVSLPGPFLKSILLLLLQGPFSKSKPSIIIIIIDSTFKTLLLSLLLIQLSKPYHYYYYY